MKIGAFITKTRPDERGDTFDQCFKMATDCFDVVTVIDGVKTWPQEFSWELIGQHFQKGYEQCDADWVVHLDTDFIFHENDYEEIRKACEFHNGAPALSFWKWQFTLSDRYNLKSRLVLAVNKASFGDRIRFDSGGDLCQPSLDGKYLTPDDVPEAQIGFYNYEKPTKTKEQIMDDVGRMDRAYQRHFGKWLYSEDGTDESAFEGWMRMATGRINKPSRHVKLSEHPQVMYNVIKNLTPKQFGYSAFGDEKNDYTKGLA